MAVRDPETGQFVAAEDLPNPGWNQGRHFFTFNSAALNTSPDGNEAIGMITGEELEDVIDWPDPRDTVFELVWGRFNVFWQPGVRGGGDEGHMIGYEVTTEDTLTETAAWAAGIPSAATGQPFTYQDVNTGTTFTNPSSLPRYVSDSETLFVAAPHQVWADSTAGYGGSLHMLHEEINFREVTGGLGPILFPSDSINSVHEYSPPTQAAIAFYENLQFFGYLHDEDAVLG